MKSHLKKGCLSGILVISIAFMLCGCNAQKGKLKIFNKHYNEGSFEKCNTFLEKQFHERKNPGGEDLLWALQAGSVKRLQKDTEASTKYFDQAEEAMKYYDLNQSKILDGIGATVVNDNVVPYLGQQYDGIMLNTYKGLNFISKNDMEMARVEFNRALDRQRRAKEKFNKEISKLRKNVDAKTAEKNGGTVKQSVENPEINKILADKYPDLSAFEVYPDFINPFTTYMSGLFFNLDGDLNKGVDLIKESYGMVPKNKYICKDLAETELALSNNKNIEGVCWVIFENGLCPVKDIWRVDLPVFLVTNKVKYVGIALPKLSYRDLAYSNLIVESGEQKYTTEIVADMDRVVQTEFKQQYPAIVSRALISATLKAAAQYAAQQQNSSAGNWASIITAAYSFATTTADIRLWTALPKDFQIARFDIPENRKIILNVPGNELVTPLSDECGEMEQSTEEVVAIENFPLEIELGNCKNAIVYVKVIKAGVPPVYNVTLF